MIRAALEVAAATVILAVAIGLAVTIVGSAVRSLRKGRP